jgi:hypothetical protein
VPLVPLEFKIRFWEKAGCKRKVNFFGLMLGGGLAINHGGL